MDVSEGRLDFARALKAPPVVVVITSTGGVTKRVFTFERPVDPGLALRQWQEYVDVLRAALTGRTTSPGIFDVLVLLGQVLELRAREKTGSAIRALLDLTPKEFATGYANGESKKRFPHSHSLDGCCGVNLQLNSNPSALTYTN